MPYLRNNDLLLEDFSLFVVANLNPHWTIDKDEFLRRYNKEVAESEQASGEYMSQWIGLAD